MCACCATTTRRGPLKDQLFHYRVMCDRSPDFERARTLQSRAWSGTELEAGAEFLAASSGLMRSVNNMSREQLMQRLQDRSSCSSGQTMCFSSGFAGFWVFFGEEAEAALKQMPKPDPEIKRESPESSPQTQQQTMLKLAISVHSSVYI